MGDAPYTGRFSMAQLQQVLEAAAPIPGDELEFLDHRTEQKVRLPRATVIVKRLEWLDAVTEMNRAHAGDMPPSKLAKRFHAIEAAATRLLNSLGAGEKANPEPARQQVTRILGWAAERNGERRGGFPNHQPDSWSHGGEEYFDYHGDSQLQDDIEAVARLRAWAAEAKSRTRARVAQGDVPPELAAIIDPLADDPVTDAIAGILHIWRDVLGRELRTSVDQEGLATGPLVRFALVCLATLKLIEGRGRKRLGEEAVRGRIRRLLDEPQFQETQDGHMREDRPQE